MNSNNAHILDIRKNSIIADIAIDFLPEIEIPAMWDVLERYHYSGFHFLNIALAGDVTIEACVIRSKKWPRADQM